VLFRSVIEIGMNYTVQGLRDFLEGCSGRFKGFPIVDSREGMVLLGYVGRAELVFALRGAKEEFACRFSDDFGREAGIDLRPWIDQTPITVHPQFPIEMVNELFRKMGFRICFVTFDGKLVGLITKKDLLRTVE